MLTGYLAFLCDNNNKGKDLNTYINYILLHTLFCTYNLRNSLNSFGTGTHVVLKGKSHELHICEPKHILQNFSRLAKARWRLQLVEPALVVKRYNSGRKRTISDAKQHKRDWFKRHERVFLEDKISQSWLGVKLETGLMKVPATGILLHIFVCF